MDCRIKSGNDETLDLVMPGLVPGIHVLAAAKKDVDGRVKPGQPFFLLMGGEISLLPHPAGGERSSERSERG